MESCDVIVAGAGPAGLAAAIGAAKRGRRVVLLEKAARPGVKILLSGGNRCNLTHDCDAAGIARAFGRAGARFLGPALRELGPRELRAWIESLGVPTKVEPGGKVFPVSDRAVDVRDALEREMGRAGVRFAGRSAVRAVERAVNGAGFVVAADSGRFAAPRVVLALGGRSYPKVGTTGDGYAIARALGHSVTSTAPALVPLVVGTPWVRSLSGVTLEDVEIALRLPAPAGAPSPAPRVVDRRRGALLFTHFGLSGPAPMNLGGAIATAETLASANVGGAVAAAGILAPALRGGAAASDAPRDGRFLSIDFLPGRSRREFDAGLRDAAALHGRRTVRAVLAALLPRRLAEALLGVCGIAPDLPLTQLSKAQRAALLDALFATRLPVEGTRGLDFAEVTRGGVPLDELDPRTLESRRLPGLYLCGELLDLDGPIGGYNFTAAFATGALAGRNAGARGDAPRSDGDAGATR